MADLALHRTELALEEMSHGRAEGESTHDERESTAPLGLRQRRPEILCFTSALVVAAFRETDTAEMKTQCGVDRVRQRLGRPVHHLVVEGPAVQRMGVRKHGRPESRARRLLPESFQIARRTRKRDRLELPRQTHPPARWRNGSLIVSFPAMRKIVHVVGTGTIGEPLIGLFADFQKHLGIDEITFHKRTPMTTERAKVNHLLQRGAKLAVDPDKVTDFEALGHTVSFEAREALERATVVIDCTPAGNENKKLYEKLSGPKGFLAQGSESGFGKPYAMGINDEALAAGQDHFLQIVSCNTHNIAALVKTLGENGENGENGSALEQGRFVCMRRSNDISQDSSFSPAPSAGKHDDPQFGTHHARDASRLLDTIGWKPRLFSSAMKLNTQYMHSLWFDLEFSHPVTREKMLERLRANRRIAMTEKRSANQIFSFGRDHGYYGRILSQAVVAAPTLTIAGDRELVGFCFTPQDGNSLASSIAAALWLMDPGFNRRERLSVLDRFFFREI